MYIYIYIYTYTHIYIYIYYVYIYIYCVSGYVYLIGKDDIISFKTEYSTCLDRSLDLAITHSTTYMYSLHDHRHDN